MAGSRAVTVVGHRRLVAGPVRAAAAVAVVVGAAAVAGQRNDPGATNASEFGDQWSGPMNYLLLCTTTCTTNYIPGGCCDEDAAAAAVAALAAASVASGSSAVAAAVAGPSLHGDSTFVVVAPDSPAGRHPRPHRLRRHSQTPDVLPHPCRMVLWV